MGGLEELAQRKLSNPNVSWLKGLKNLSRRTWRRNEKAEYEGILIKKDGENLENSKAKAQHVMKGFSENEGENLETTTPQCGKDTVLCMLQLLCSQGWPPASLDFTQAFHSGDEIQREVYDQPSECTLPGLLPRQLLRLLKSCYGLLDGPHAWHQHAECRGPLSILPDRSEDR